MGADHCATQLELYRCAHNVEAVPKLLALLWNTYMKSPLESGISCAGAVRCVGFNGSTYSLVGRSESPVAADNFCIGALLPTALSQVTIMSPLFSTHSLGSRPSRRVILLLHTCAPDGLILFTYKTFVDALAKATMRLLFPSTTEVKTVVKVG